MNQAMDDGETPLSIALDYGFVDVVKELVAAGGAHTAGSGG